MIQTVSTLTSLRQTLIGWREAGQSVAFVPTMGALHKGHMALVDSARKVADRVIVSIFVNPTQFGPKEDFSKYPRALDQDKQMLERAGADLVYTPDVKEIYPDGFVTEIHPGPMAGILEGAFRPTHFAGVATIVTKLLLQVMPDAAFFGEKDYQQLLIIRRVTRDLNIPVHIVGVPIVRDADGLALSSRNVYLSADERKRAVALPQALQEAAAALRAGKDIAATLQTAKQRLTDAGFTIDYLELVDTHNLESLTRLDRPGRLIATARMGATRLLDNLAVASS